MFNVNLIQNINIDLLVYRHQFELSIVDAVRGYILRFRNWSVPIDTQIEYRLRDSLIRCINSFLF
jgi:hypothetical protein